MQKKLLCKVWNEGYTARINGKTHAENPYTFRNSVLADEWNAGFEQAIQDLKDRKNDNDV